MQIIISYFFGRDELEERERDMTSSLRRGNGKKKEKESACKWGRM